MKITQIKLNAEQTQRLYEILIPEAIEILKERKGNSPKSRS